MSLPTSVRPFALGIVAVIALAGLWSLSALEGEPRPPERDAVPRGQHAPRAEPSAPTAFVAPPLVGRSIESAPQPATAASPVAAPAMHVDVFVVTPSGEPALKDARLAHAKLRRRSASGGADSIDFDRGRVVTLPGFVGTTERGDPGDAIELSLGDHLLASAPIVDDTVRLEVAPARAETLFASCVGSLASGELAQGRVRLWLGTKRELRRPVTYGERFEFTDLPPGRAVLEVLPKHPPLQAARDSDVAPATLFPDGASLVRSVTLHLSMGERHDAGAVGPLVARVAVLRYLDAYGNRIPARRVRTMNREGPVAVHEAADVHLVALVEPGEVEVQHGGESHRLAFELTAPVTTFDVSLAPGGAEVRQVD